MNLGGIPLSEEGGPSDERDVGAPLNLQPCLAQNVIDCIVSWSGFNTGYWDVLASKFLEKESHHLHP